MKNLIILSIFCLVLLSCTLNKSTVTWVKNNNVNKKTIQNKDININNNSLVFTWESTISTGVITETPIKKASSVFINKKKNIPRRVFDFSSDSSIQKFVSQDRSFTKLSYSPDDLVSIEWRKEAFENLKLLSWEFYNHFKADIIVVSGFRDYSYQSWIKNRWCPDNLCAKAWYSEHQSWLAIDLFEATTKKEFLSKKELAIYFEWLNANAYRFWFINTYKKGFEVDWYDIEPWHWRYVWAELATYMHTSWETFAEIEKGF